MKMQMAELYLNGATDSCLFAAMATCSNIAELASKLERLDCSHWFYSKHRREYQSKLTTDHSSGER